MNKWIYLCSFFLVFSSCELLRNRSNKTKPKEAYTYYAKDFVLPAESPLRTDGIYYRVSKEKFVYKSKNYDKYYKQRPHPVIGDNRPKNDTTIYFNRWYYYQFSRNGDWISSGGYYSKEEMLAKASPFNATGDYPVYKIEKADTNVMILDLETYNWYRNDFIYLKGKAEADSLWISGQAKMDKKPEFDRRPYVFHPFTIK
ncbi:hypothetical protein KO02_00290 [Sphingobacterium sp. ML3W]|uniref:hypothetical protein n=1 Tax=Sphingobacterium sp. ML3W TaxID=1538644 RepID=UPI0004F6A382|nr:hypothetical protein [Sphingobacterium sp. ML3W]AIM35276.1 hypothetical protein KO02_00290 [Sphingobacterium sp. ML3W]